GLRVLLPGDADEHAQDVRRLVLLLPGLAERLDRRRIAHALEVSERVVHLLAIVQLVDPGLRIGRDLLAARPNANHPACLGYSHGHFRFLGAIANITSVYSAA